MLSVLLPLLVACPLSIRAVRWENKTIEWCHVAALLVGPAAFSYHSYLEPRPGLVTCPHSVVVAGLPLSFILPDKEYFSLEDYRPCLHSGAPAILAVCCLHSEAPFSYQSVPRESEEMFASDH